MTLPFNPNQELASIIARFAKEDGDHPTPIGSVTLFRQSMSTPLQHGAYKPAYALVVQGRKSLTGGAETFRYGAGHYVLTALDLPVSTQVTDAGGDAPYLCFAMTLE